MGSSHGKSSTISDQSVEGTVSSDVVETFVAEEKEEILHTRRRKPNPRLSRVPKGIEGELVVAGWPNWLVSVAGDALNGWLPRRADTFEKIDKIGQGTYSNVYKARDRLLNKVVALKKVRFDNLDPESVKFMAREIIILRKLGDHPNVIKLEGVVTSKMSYSLYLVFDFMEYDLKAIQEQKGFKFSEPEIKCYMNQLLKGLDHCHCRGILHRDNKPGPLTSNIVTLWYRPPELLLGSNSYGVGVDLWGVGCIFRPIEPYRRILHATFHDLPAAAVGLMDTLLSLKAEYRGTAALALQNEFFTTEPFACDPSSLPQCPLRRVRNYERNRRVRAIPAAEANAEFKSNIDRKRLIAHSEAQNRLEKTNEYVSGGALDEGINSSECFQVSSRKEGSENYTQISVTPSQRNSQRAIIRKEPIHDIKGKKKWFGTLPAPSDKMHDLLIEHDPMILKPARRAKLEKGSTAKGNDHDSKGKKNHSLCPSTSTSNATIGNGQISTHYLPNRLICSAY
ncbi:hypothetical protein KY289_030082 [Solanum tuberosum]|nr:hypothetical protein KY289_030082 [Solanum tuberosum]